ncbi:hypothetical protein P3S68_019706 [Capsicum galapagoense]
MISLFCIPFQILPFSFFLSQSELSLLLHCSPNIVRQSSIKQGGAEDRSKRMKEDAMLLLRGFDSVSCSLLQLSDNLENALQGARNLAKPPTLTEILHYTMEKERSEENQSKENKCEGYKGKEGSEEGGNRGLKRKLDSEESSENPQQDDDTKRENQQVLKELGKFKKAKNLAISVASKEDTLAQELKSMRSNFRFMQERSSLLEEDNDVFVMDMAQGYHQKKMTWRSWIQALETTSGRNTRMMFYYLTTISKSGSMPLLLRLWHKQQGN